MKLNKKGFTLVEIIVSISLLSIILVFMLSSLVKIRSVATYSTLNTETMMAQATVSKTINSDVKKKCGISSISCESQYDCVLTFNNSDERKISVLNDGKTLKYSDPTTNQTVFLKTLSNNSRFNIITQTNDEVLHPGLKTLKIKMLAEKNYDIYIYDFYPEDTRCIDEDFIASKTFNYKNEAQEYTVEKSGTYKIELWGASGGNVPERIGAGAYTAGNIYLNKDTKLYFYTGQTGLQVCNTTAFNGGGMAKSNGTVCGVSGGGATDVRTSSGTWNDATSLRDRIMVAGGAGGGGGVAGEAGDTYNSCAGGLTAYYGYVSDAYLIYSGIPGGQTTNTTIPTSHSCATSLPTAGSFGAGGTGGANQIGSTGGGGSGGGGGYYGGSGSSGLCNGTWGGAGGSSFISGHNGCNAVNSSGVSTGSSLHFSGLAFTNTVMIDGRGFSWTNTKGSQVQMPNPNDGYYNLGIGHSGNGVARITFID